MSWWIYGRDKRGRPSIWQIDFDPLLIIIVLGLLVGLVGPRLRRPQDVFSMGSIGLLIAGVACLAVAKSSLWRRGIWVSWGPKDMTEGYARLYKLGGAGIVLGSLLLLGMWRFTVEPRASTDRRLAMLAPAVEHER